jgi:hypothetical protein
MKKKLLWWGFGILTFIIGWATIPILATLLTPVIASVVATTLVSVVASVSASCIVGATLLAVNKIGKKLKDYLFGKSLREEKKQRKRFERLKTLEEDIKFLKENKNLERKIDGVRFNEPNEFDLLLKNKINDVKLNKIPKTECENTYTPKPKIKYVVH